MKLGFIGTGNMGGALAKAAAKKPENIIYLANRHREKAEALAAEKIWTTAPVVCESAEALAASDVLFLGVKPQMLRDLCGELREALAAKKEKMILVDMAAGTSIEKLRGMLGGDYPVIRIMPNTPVSTGEGMTLYCCSENVSEDEEKAFLEAMSASGRFAKIDEAYFSAGSAVSGCGPAFLDMFVEALADGGVACGLKRAQAIEFAAQMCLGAAKLILESGEHPDSLRDKVCSPGGTTIQGVRVLEESAFRGAVMDAVIAAYDKDQELSRK